MPILALIISNYKTLKQYLISHFSLDLLEPEKRYYITRKQLQHKLGDPVDKYGTPPPNESLTNFYLVIKNVNPASARRTIYDAIPPGQIKDLVGMEEVRTSSNATTMYVSFESVSAASLVLNSLPPFVNGRRIWRGHAASKYI